MLFSLVGVSQNDTIIYFSKLNRVINSKNDAQYYDEIKTDKKGNISYKSFQLNENKWINIYEGRIQKENDTLCSYYSLQNKKEKQVRSFFKTDSGYNLKNYLGSRLISEGFSRTIFPENKFGLWREYDPSNGKLLSEGTYNSNQLITNKYLIPSGSYVKDVFTYVDKKFEYEGGDEMLLKFIAENTEYPEAARDNNITGRVILKFILMKDGSINGIDFLERTHYLLELEAIRVINLIPESKWKPAEINGEKVNTPIMIPINFNISEINH